MRQIIDQINTIISNGIKQVLEGEIKIFRSDLTIAGSDIQNIMETFGFKLLKTRTNGWECDYWIDFNKGKKEYTAQISAYYGKFTFYKKEEQ